MIDSKDVVVGVRTTSERKALYREYAEREGMQLADWLRYLADQRIAQAAIRRVAGAA